MRSKLILLVISLCVCSLLAELVLRMSGRYQTYTERTDTGAYVSPYDVGYIKTWYRTHAPKEQIRYTNKEFSAGWTTNNEGFNDRDFTHDKKGRRIIILGDSFTEGSGATSNDSSYPRQLGYLVRDSIPAAEVWNCGVGGSDLFFEYVLLRDKIINYKPDAVIVTINNTDIYEEMIRGGFERFGKDGKTHYKKSPWFEPLFAHSYVVRTIVLNVFRYNWSLIKNNDEAQLKETAIKELCTAMDSFAVLSASKNISLLFVFHPMKNEMEARERYFANTQVAYCRQRGYDYVDAREDFGKMGINAGNAGSVYWPVDGHLNDKGYRYLASSVWGGMRRQMADQRREQFISGGKR